MSRSWRRLCGAGLLGALGLWACGGQRPLLGLPPEPAAGFWFDDFRAARLCAPSPEPLAGAARLRITPPDGVVLAGHGFNKRARGRLDDLWARALYLDSGPEALVLVSVDLIGLSLPRVERIRARVSRQHPERILIAATHNHAGPDTLGLWGPAALGLLPVKSGMDPAYMEWLEERVARVIRRAVASARPARLYAGRFELPAGLAQNLREPEDVPRQAQVLRLADRRDGSTLATVVHWGCHAESLQDWNQLLSADFPGVLYAELEDALGGVAMFVSGPAGGMVEPANDPLASEPARLAFRVRLGGALAGGAIRQAVAGMREIPLSALRVRSRRVDIAVQVGGLLDLAFGLGLLDPRPLVDGRLTTEVALVELGPVRLATLPGEPTPELGRAFEAVLGGEFRWVVGLVQDELGYLLSARQWAEPAFEYERSMSLGPGAAQQLLGAVEALARSE
jgi:hypothetical protein